MVMTDARVETPVGGALQLVTPGKPGYDTYRKAWNSLFDRRPAAIARCRSAQEVAEAVRFAVRHGLPVAVRSGGHSAGGYSTIEGGLLIDLSPMKALAIDPEKRVAVAEPGLTWGEYTAQTAHHGLATPAGDSASVGVGGLALGGGIGWLARKHGMNIDHLISAQIVTAAGEIMVASETENPDLFWAIRGGGGNFGVVTRFEFGLVPVGEVLAGILVLPAEPEVLEGYANLALQAPDELTTIAKVMRTPPAPFLPPDLYGKVNLHVLLCYAGDTAEGEQATAALATSGPVLGRMVAPMPYPGIFKFSEAGAASHACSAATHFLEAFDEDVARAVTESAREATSPLSMLDIRPLGGQLARVPAEATAFAHRARPFLVSTLSLWEAAPGQPETVHRSWAEDLGRRLGPHSKGGYVGFQGDGNGGSGDLARAAYPPATYARLASVKAKYDPSNLFRSNTNILPGK